MTGYEAADKIKIIKEVKAILNLGLKEAKDLVEKLPAKMGSALSKADADSLVEKLKAFGCKVELV
jgi:large subunit ribosomal protein L7/L12